MRLADKVVLITGAGGAIGTVAARAMANEGARLVLVDRDEQALAHVCRVAGDAPLLAVLADVTSRADTERMCSMALERFGRLDGFFANAGVEGSAVPISEYTEDVYRRVMTVNVKSVFLGLQSVVTRMADGGSIVINSSIMGVSGAPRNAAYSASKHAVVGLMRSAANEAAPRRIRVNSVHPGIVDSPMVRRTLAHHPDPEASLAGFRQRIKLGQLVQPFDIAAAVVFLVSDESRMITSQTLVVDGGMLG
jgi:NAD(P)-dependent dehydrogenase (short-subunit alcohol dehydrogenase family)